MSYLVSNSNISAGEIIGDAKTVLTRCVPVPTGSKRTDYPIGTPVYLIQGIAYPVTSGELPFYGVVYSNRNLKSDDDTRLNTGVEDTVEVIVSGTVGIKCADETQLPSIGETVIYDGTTGAGICIGVCDGTGKDRAGNACVAVRLTGDAGVSGTSGEIIKEFKTSKKVYLYNLVEHSDDDNTLVQPYTGGANDLIGIAITETDKVGDPVKVLLKGKITVPFVDEGSAAYAKLLSSQINGIKSSQPNVELISIIIAAIGVASAVTMTVFSIVQAAKSEKRQAKLDAYYSNKTQNSVGTCQGMYRYTTNQAVFLDLCEQHGVNADDIDGWLTWDFQPNTYVGTTEWKKYKLADVPAVSNDADRLSKLTHGRKFKDSAANEEAKPVIGHIYAVGVDTNGETVCFDLNDIQTEDDDEFGDYEIAGVCTSEEVTSNSNGDRFINLLREGKGNIEINWGDSEEGKTLDIGAHIDFKRMPMFERGYNPPPGGKDWHVRVGTLMQEAINEQDSQNASGRNRYAVNVKCHNPNTYVEVYPTGELGSVQVPSDIDIGSAVVFETRYIWHNKRHVALTFIRALRDPYDMQYFSNDNAIDFASLSSGRFGVVTHISEKRDMCVVQTAGFVKHPLNEYETNIQIGDRVCVRRVLRDKLESELSSVIAWDGQAGQNSIVVPSIDEEAIIPVAQPPMPTIGVVKEVYNLGESDGFCIVELEPRVEMHDHICTDFDIKIPGFTVCTGCNTFITAPITGIDQYIFDSFVHLNDTLLTVNIEAWNECGKKATNAGAVKYSIDTVNKDVTRLREPVLFIKLDYSKVSANKDVINKMCHFVMKLKYEGDSETAPILTKHFFVVFHDGTKPTPDPEEPEPVVVQTTAKKTAKKSKKTSEE